MKYGTMIHSHHKQYSHGYLLGLNYPPISSYYIGYKDIQQYNKIQDKLNLSINHPAIKKTVFRKALFFLKENYVDTKL